MSWQPPPAPVEIPPDGLLGVPVTRLYDRGRTLTPTAFLHPRLAEPHVVLHPEVAAGLDVVEGSTVHIHLDGSSTAVTIRLDEAVPAGIVLIPRSLGMPISGPMPVEIKVPVVDG